MRLKRVTMAGFKSFADKVDFDFGSGVTCIVGPNGCGKSNVLDAVKWVLGEQSARSLRGRSMTDMIFNGSSSRKSSSVAQVDLIFDNADRTLPLDQEEVVVTRKLYRSGESEYQVNRDVTRLKDIRELFMDTGVGTVAYSIIEQGRVDILLQSSPVERRLIFEEAAGISKYKARKREAQRKMERTDQNLLRVADVIEVVEKQLRSVKLQAGKARNFLAYQDRLNELRASYSLAEYHRHTQRITSLNEQSAALHDGITEIKTQISRHEAEEADLVVRLDGVAEDISKADSALVRAQSDLATHRERIEAAGRRLAEQEEALERSVRRQAADDERLVQCHDELDRAQASAIELQNETHDLHHEIDRLVEQDRAFAQELTRGQAMLEDEKAGIIEILRKSAQTHNEITRLNTHRESLLGQKGRLASRDAQIKSELEGLLSSRAQMKRRLVEVVQLIEAEEGKLVEKKAEAGRTGTIRQQLIDEIAANKERRSALQSRTELLSDLQRKKDGVGAGVRRVLDAADSGAWSFVRGLVADVFETDVSHAPIIEAALGNADQYVIVAEGGAFREALGGLGELPGRVTALCLDRLPPRLNERDFSEHEGFVSRAIDLVRFDEAFEDLARHLLGKTIVVETLGHALSMAARDAAGHRFITLAAELVEPDGRIGIGPSASQAGLISRKSELADIDIQLAALEAQIERLADQLNRTEAEAGHLERIQQELRTAVYESNTAKVEATAAMQNLDEGIRRLTDEQPMIAGEVGTLELQIEEVLLKSEEGGRSLAAMEEENQRREQVVRKYQNRIDEVVAEREQTQSRLTELKVRAGQLTEKRAAAAEAINHCRRQSSELSEAIEVARGDQARHRAAIEEAKQTLDDGEARVAELARSIESIEAEATRLRGEREQMRIQHEEIGQATKVARARLGEVEAKLHDLEMALGETRVRRDELAARVKEELHIDLAARYAEYEHAEQDWEAVEAEIAELKSKIDRLGNVNLDAITELEELEQRYTFLSGQRDDLTESLKQLNRLIDQLNKESLHRFKESFDQIRGHFRELFRKLFGGGRADIILENPDDLLESGIEILAQPPGKELQGISLMSGGEKTMTAIALLMSVFKSRPAPYAILDEVDAALDELNNERFNKIVGEFVKESQFIIITHSKRTMTIADQLYGITMQEPGVSTRVSVRLGDANVA
jgi:chromosome segregation protein